MSVVDGQKATAANLNAAFVSKSTNSTATSILTLNNTSDVNSGNQVSNLQRCINELFDAAGSVEGDSTRNNYTSTNYITNGDDRKEALQKLDAALYALSLGTSGFNQFLVSNNAAAADVTGLIVSSGTYKSFEVKYLAYRESISTGANIKAQRGRLLACFNGTSWEIVETAATPTDAGVTFTIDTTTGQVKVATDNQAGTFQASTSYVSWKLDGLV